MGIKTGVIRFNVKDRGRRFRGQDRNFDTVAMAKLINSGEVQEKVKHGDMLGYYGHWARVKFGLDVGEGGLVKGKQIQIEPAIRTISLKAYDDGTIEHETEFLDTAPGRLAARLYNSKAGGFSSAINAPRRGSMQVPQSFHGFDYVLEPNFTGNRGYALDSAGNRIETEGLSEDELAILDDVGQYNSLVEATNAVLDQVQAEFDRQAEVVILQQQENVELQSEIARLQVALDSVKAEAAKAKAELAAIAVPEVVPETPAPSREEVLDAAKAMTLDAAESRFARADEFAHAELTSYEEPKVEREETLDTAADRHIERRFGVGRPRTGAR